MHASRSVLVLYGVHLTSWFVSFGMLSTFLPGYAATALGASAHQIGVLQASFFMPSLALLLVGGMLADRYDRRVLMGVSLLAGAVATVTAALLLFVLDPYGVLIAFGLALGIANAFLNPSRDGMIPHLVPTAALPRTVAGMIGLQFLAQIAGIGLAGRLDLFGPRGLLVIQAVILVAGALVVPWLPRAQAAPALTAQSRTAMDVVLTTVTIPFAVSRTMTAAILSSVLVGVCFVGSFLVIVPELVLRTHGLGVADLSTAIIAFTLGNLVSIFALVSSRAWTAMPGRYLIVGILAGAGVLVALPLAPDFHVLLGVMLLWGMLAGVVMTTGRTLVQMMAADEIRGRCLAMSNLGFFGGSPVGALLMGAALTWLPAPIAGIAFASVAVAGAAALAATSELWRRIPSTPVSGCT